MITKIWCWLFGHIKYNWFIDVATSKAIGETVHTKRAVPECVRCGRKL